ncbi:IS3 family transposase [bacterium]|nr:IS3 family transposase [bacterium]NBX51115.1 IS3 family transposase [bacterium]
MEKAKSKQQLAKELGIARSSLYYKPKKPKEDADIKEKILALQHEHPAYGHRRIALFLGMNRKRIHRIMQKFHIRPRIVRGKPWKPGDIGKPVTGIPNLAKHICPIQGNVLWAGDFTYIPWRGDFIYLATVIDVYSREIVGWHIGERHTADLVIEAFQSATERTGKRPQIFHSDQGSEYVSGRYELLLANFNVKPSQSHKGHPWENGFQESFYNQFKLEFGKPARFTDLGELIEAIHQQLRYYNYKRIHLALKMPPIMFRELRENKNTALVAV